MVIVFAVTTTSWHFSDFAQGCSFAGRPPNPAMSRPCEISGWQFDGAAFATIWRRESNDVLYGYGLKPGSLFSLFVSSSLSRPTFTALPIHSRLPSHPFEYYSSPSQTQLAAWSLLRCKSSQPLPAEDPHVAWYLECSAIFPSPWPASDAVEWTHSTTLAPLLASPETQIPARPQNG